MSLLSIFSTNGNKGQAANGKKRKWIISAVLLAVVVAAFCVWKSFQPRHVAIVLTECSEKADQLPSPKEFIATLYLGNEVRRDTIKTFGDKASFGEIDHAYDGQNVRLTIQGDHYLPIDTTFALASGTLEIGMQRDAEEYGRVRFHADGAKPADQALLRQRVCAVAAVELTGDVREHLRKVGVLLPEYGAVFLQHFLHPLPVST